MGCQPPDVCPGCNLISVSREDERAEGGRATQRCEPRPGVVLGARAWLGLGLGLRLGLGLGLGSCLARAPN